MLNCEQTVSNMEEQVTRLVNKVWGEQRLICLYRNSLTRLGRQISANPGFPAVAHRYFGYTGLRYIHTLFSLSEFSMCVPTAF